jgi:uncharacterized protein YdaU (DUF1376 family)
MRDIPELLLVLQSTGKLEARGMSHAFMMFYPGDYLRDTGHLSTEEHGAYLLLLWHAWTQNGVLPPDDELLRRITRLAPKAWARSRAIVLGFFTLKDDGYHQKRMDRELAKARAMVAKRREAVERTQQWRAANPLPKPNGQAPPDDPPVMHNERITNAQQVDNVMPPLSAPYPEPQLYPVLEERKKVNKLTSFSSTMRARPEPPGDALSALMADAGIEKPERIDRSNDEPAISDPVILATIRKATKACTMRVPYGEVRSVHAQLDALQAQPQAVGADATMGLRWQPAAPVRTPAEQLAALLGISLADAEARVPAAAA